ncbi:MAG: DNA double-strand break repair nuclease NurA [Nanoarchaeota archaeon]|nr:DNA double-strand break repair nuclease NurA [Nanoarchaeota archaeon]
MKKLAAKILASIKTSEKDIPLLDNNYKTEQFSKDNFKKIIPADSDKNIIFIDGGSAEILKAANISLFFNRVYYTVYKNNKRIQNKLYEFYTLITAMNKNDKLFFKAETYQNDFEFSILEFDSMDATLTTGKSRVEISKLGDVIRRFGELKIAYMTAEKEAIIVIDGSLEEKYTYEDDFLKKLCNSGNIVCGLSKTTRDMTNNGNSITASLSVLSPFREWYYRLTQNDNADLYFVKLNKNSGHIFKLEVNRANQCNINEVLSILKKNSIDPVFLGYPYGLIEADRFSRISNKEKERIKLQLKLIFGKKFKEIESIESSLDAHGILDSIS